MHPIEKLLAQELLSKPLSALYLVLLSVDPKMERLWDLWKADLPKPWLGGLSWRYQGTKLLISSREKLIQIKFLQRLHRIYPQRSQECPRCRDGIGTYLHMSWSCPRVVRFWGEVVWLIHFPLQLTLLVSPELVFLGIQDDEQRPRCTKLLLLYLFYYAKREIILKWNARFPPSVGSREKSINAAPTMYKVDLYR